jgi:hypothetical protein
LPNANTEGFANAVIKLIATTVPGSAREHHRDVDHRLASELHPRDDVSRGQPGKIAPTTAMALISRLMTIGSHDSVAKQAHEISIVLRRQRRGPATRLPKSQQKDHCDRQCEEHCRRRGNNEDHLFPHGTRYPLPLARRLWTA